MSEQPKATIVEYGYALRELRKSRGLGLTELAQDLGMSKQSLSNIETGKMLLLPIETVRMIAEHLGYDLMTVVNLADNLADGLSAIRSAVHEVTGITRREIGTHVDLRFLDASPEELAKSLVGLCPTC